MSSSERDHDTLKDFYRLYLLSQDRNRAPARYPGKYFDEIFSSGELSPDLTLYMAYFEGVAIAGIVTVRSGGAVHYLHGGMDYRYRQYCASDLLFFTAIRDAAASGAVEFDLGGTSPSDEALLQFKLKWGAVPVSSTVMGKDLGRIRCSLMDIAIRMLGLPPIRGLYNRGRKRD